MYWQKMNLPVILSIVWTFSERICYAWRGDLKIQLQMEVATDNCKFFTGIWRNMDYVEIWILNIYDDLDCVLLGCDTVKSGGWYERICYLIFSTLQYIQTSFTLIQKMEEQFPPIYWYPHTKRNDVITQKAKIYMLCRLKNSWWR
jgi:hypothetical protein